MRRLHRLTADDIICTMREIQVNNRSSSAKKDHVELPDEEISTSNCALMKLGQIRSPFCHFPHAGLVHHVPHVRPPFNTATAHLLTWQQIQQEQ
jgi:hypothetical protein